MAGDSVPDNPDGSGDAFFSCDGSEIPYHYEHVPGMSVWEVQTIIPYCSPTSAHLNTYCVPGYLLGGFLVEMDDEEHAERVISIRRVAAKTKALDIGRDTNIRRHENGTGR